MKQSIKNNSANADELFLDAERKADRGNFRGAFKSHMAAAQLGNVLSQLALGNYYSAGRGVEKDLKEAARWYKKAYRNGVSAGAVNLSVDLQRQGSSRAAITWLKKAVDMDDGDACVMLAKIYIGKRGHAKAVYGLLRKATSFSRSKISDEAREQAEALLASIRNRS